jgi:hypothetical protein
MGNDVNIKSCPYKGDGLAGWGKLMEGFSNSHGQRTGWEKNKDHTDDLTIVDSVRNISHLNPAAKECLAKYLTKACNDYQNPYWTKDQAEADVKEVHDAIFYKYKHETLPELLNKQCMYGLYNDTSTQIIADRAYVESVFAATTITMDTIHKYFEHFRDIASIVIEGLNTAIADTTADKLDSRSDRDIDEQKQKDYHWEDGLNLDELATDMGLIIVAAYVLETFLKLTYGECQ